MIAADDLDLGMLREPFRCLLRRSDRQHVNDVATLQINDDRRQCLRPEFGKAPVLATI